jgi:hypothetical protein
VEHAKFLENQINSGWEMYIRGSPTQLATAEKFRVRTARIIKDPKLADGMTPKWSVGCRLDLLLSLSSISNAEFFLQPNHTWRSIHARNTKAEC